MSTLILLHSMCLSACWCIWALHCILLVIFDSDRDIIHPSIWRKIFAIIIWWCAFTIPEIALYLSYRFIVTDVSDLRKYYEDKKRSGKGRELGN
jgi:hypothetical protein